MDIRHALLLAALCLLWYNVAIIWFAQRVVYPLFARVGSTEY